MTEAAVALDAAAVVESAIDRPQSHLNTTTRHLRW